MIAANWSDATVRELPSAHSAVPDEPRRRGAFRPVATILREVGGGPFGYAPLLMPRFKSLLVAAKEISR